MKHRKGLLAEQERIEAGEELYVFHLPDGSVFSVRRPTLALARLALRRAAKIRSRFEARYEPLKQQMQRRLRQAEQDYYERLRHADALAGKIPFNERTFWD